MQVLFNFLAFLYRNMLRFICNKNRLRGTEKCKLHVTRCQRLNSNVVNFFSLRAVLTSN